jgi:hypothetical protein
VKTWQRFLYGCAGAIAPEIIRLHNAFKPTSGFNVTVAYVLVSAAFVALGGIVAMAWKDEHEIKSVYIGSTFPIWLSAWVHLLAPSVPGQ